MRRVVITSQAAVTPVGLNAGDFWESLKAGRHGFAPISAFDTSRVPVKYAAEIKDWDPGSAVLEPPSPSMKSSWKRARIGFRSF